MTWFQFANACANSGAVLPSNGLWQVAAAGTPTEECNVGNVETELTGSNESCVSNRGLYDMVGNVWEWCADDYDAKYYSESPDNNPTGLEDAIIFEGNDFTGVESA